MKFPDKKLAKARRLTGRYKTKTMVASVFVFLLLVYLFLVVIVYFSQQRMLYYPVKELTAVPSDIGLEYEEVTLKTKDNISIFSWYVPADSERGVVLFCHGNAGNISHRLDSIRIFHHLRLGVFIFDYRGYGRSEGYPSEKGTYLDAEAAWDYLVNARRIAPERIIIFGRSLGSAVAAETALRLKAGALIIESGFTSIPDLGRKFYPYLPVRLISRFQYATINKVNRINIPKLFIHSPEDEIIPFEHGTALFDKAAEPKEFLHITGSHNEGFLVSGNIYTEGLRGFVSTHLGN